MQDVLSQTYYGNSINQWATALAIVVGTLVAAKAVYWIFGNVFRRMTRHTTTEIDDRLVDMLDRPVVALVTALGVWVAIRTLTLPDATLALIWNAVQMGMMLAVAWMAARVFDTVIRVALEPMAQETESDLDDQLLPIVRRGGRAAIWALGIIVALNNAGYDVAALIAGLGIGGLALAMAAQDTVKNIFGGFTIFTDRPFSINDWIKAGGFEGTVSEIGLRSTRVQTFAGREVTIPNSTIANSPVENVSREPSRRVKLNLGLTYDTTPEAMQRAMAILRDIVADHADLQAREPVVAFNAFGDFAMNILFQYYILAGADVMETQTRMNLAILERFNAEGLEFAFPTQTIFTQPVDTDAAAR
ncbi:MAG TPA: mechanosensitive ion channel family protein [Acidobacteriota bacterium]|nr:mechanosensitive ion channel family protein [Acidobacteriota bacterium]